jgi:hypothetical protein
VTAVSVCTGYIAYSGSDRIDKPCAMDATETVTAGCEHEHIGNREFCPMHAGDAHAGVLLCGDCLDGRSPHLCRLRVLASAPLG